MYFIVINVVFFQERSISLKYMEYMQYKIQDINSGAIRVCWLDKKINVGSKITLKDEEGQFIVLEKYGTIDSSILALNRNPNWKTIPKSENDPNEFYKIKEST